LAVLYFELVHEAEWCLEHILLNSLSSFLFNHVWGLCVCACACVCACVCVCVCVCSFFLFISTVFLEILLTILLTYLTGTLARQHTQLLLFWS
jgi:hypothetical protein